MARRLHLAGFLLLGAIALVHRRVQVEHFEFRLHIGHFAHADNDLAATFDDRIDCLVQGKGLRMVLVVGMNSDANSTGYGIFWVVLSRRWHLGLLSGGGKQRRKGHKCLMVELMLVMREPVGRWW